MATIYISHSNIADPSWATGFGEAFNKHSHNVWACPRDFAPEFQWTATIEAGVQNSSLAIILLAGEHESQREVFFELGYLHASQKRLIFVSPSGQFPSWIPAELRSGAVVPMTTPEETASLIAPLI